jgi:hypothetical protein
MRVKIITTFFFMENTGTGRATEMGRGSQRTILCEWAERGRFFQPSLA